MVVLLYLDDIRGEIEIKLVSAFLFQWRCENFKKINKMKYSKHAYLVRGTRCSRIDADIHDPVFLHRYLCA